MGFFTRRDEKQGDEDAATDRDKKVSVSVSVSESLPPSRSRSRSRSKPRSREIRDVQESARPGIVSGVLSDPAETSTDSPHHDIVERRFGQSAESSGRTLPESKKRSAASENESAAASVVLDMQELETPDLEVDSMAHIGRSTTINGDIVAGEDLEIEGTVEGTVTLSQNRVSIGAEGVVKARVQAASVVVAGRIEGDVTAAEVIEVKAGGYIGGNVKSPRVILQDGAIVIGGLDMSAALPKVADGKDGGPTRKSDPTSGSARGSSTSPKVATATPAASSTSSSPTDNPVLIRVEPSSAEASMSKDSA